MIAWNEGYESFKLGLSPDDCPYDGFDETAWAKGYQSAAEEA